MIPAMIPPTGFAGRWPGYWRYSFGGWCPLAWAVTCWRTFAACARVSPNRSMSWFCDSGFPAAMVARNAVSAAFPASLGTGDGTASGGPLPWRPAARFITEIIPATTRTNEYAGQPQISAPVMPYRAP